MIGADGVHLGRNVRKRLRRDGLRTTANAAFGQVAEACRAGREPRWLTDALLGSLTELHDQGWAHSIEVWLDDDLVGGAMGIGIGGVMSGDSLFGRHQGAAAIAVADMRRAAAGGRRDGHRRAVGQPVPPLARRRADARERYLALLDRPAEPVRLPTRSLPAAPPAAP